MCKLSLVMESLRYVLNIAIQGVVLCVERIITVVTFLSYCGEFESCESGFAFATAL
jgi:hypothetical protein